MNPSAAQSRIAELRKAAAAHGDSAQHLRDLADALLGEGNLDEAINCYKQAVALRPDVPETHNNMGVALARAGRMDQALEAYGRALELRPDYAEVHNNLGLVMCDRRDWNAEIACFNQAVRLKPDFADAHGNLGNALYENGSIDAAIACYRRALSLRPDSHGTHNNLANALCALGDFDAAMAATRRSLELNPNFAEAHLSLSIMLLLQGDLEHGWPEYEWRWKSREHRTPSANFAQPPWDGSDLNGKRILLHSEQALGDTIHFVRYAPQLTRRGGKVIVACQPEMASLLGGADGVETVVDRHGALPPFDVHCPLLSLPGMFKTTLRNIPADVPYLRADETRVRQWLNRIPADNRRKVGLVWSGGAHPPGRAVPLEQLARLAEIPNIWFCSLQKGEAAAALRSSQIQMADWTDELHDFADTAALVENLDLVISVDTAVAHLAGAMGKPVWVLLKFVPDWRWMLQRADSPWYPTMRLFRQSRLGDWKAPIALLTTAVATP